MKKTVFAALAAALLLTSCGGGDKNPADTTEQDWRNRIEYEGSFYVDRETKLLYANDKGKITLWDNGGSGSVLQTVEYDTYVNDAADRVETEDFNSDGFTDLRVVYSESDEGVCYNLWLWSQKDMKFTECRPYRNILSPETTEDGKILGTKNGATFGKLETVYSFTDELSIEAESFGISEDLAVADSIIKLICQTPTTVEKSEGHATIDGVTCPVFNVIHEDSSEDYLAYNDKGEWLYDARCSGMYRCLVLTEKGTVDLGRYVGEAGAVQQAAEKILGELPRILLAEKGTIADSDAVKYTLSTENGRKELYIITESGGLWYCSEDGVAYSVLNSSDGTQGEGVSIIFKVKLASEG